LTESQPVPLADEIRAARAELRRAELASLELAHIEVALALVSRGLPPDPEWAAGFASRWPELPVLPTDKTLLLAMRGALTPVARGLAAAANRVHHLQHEQRAALDAPELESLRAELDRQLAELGALAERRVAPVQRAAALGPALRGVNRAAAELAGSDPARASALAEALMRSVEPVLAALALDAERPSPSDPPAEAIASLQRSLGALNEQASAEAAEAQAAWEAMNQRLLERMG
jgi:hypothetical protein